MEQTLMVMQYEKTLVRTAQGEDGKVWFVAMDICECLNIVWKGSETLLKIPEMWRKMSPEFPESSFLDALGRDQDVILISEPAVYKLAFRSNKPDADAFTNWVAGEVLPSLRQTGMYRLPADLVRKLDLWEQFNDVGRKAIAALQDLVDIHQRENERLRKEVDGLRQKNKRLKKKCWGKKECE